MRIAVGADHAGFQLKQLIAADLRHAGHEVVDHGTDSEAPVDYPDFAEAVAKSLIGGQAERGVLICGSGVGASVAINKIPGIRAGLCHDSYSARQGVEHDEINRHYSATDIYLNASKIDNQPLSILEAFTCGLPVVTTDAGGIPDIVTDEITGFLVPVGTYESLAARALKLLTHPDIAQTMTARARAECTKYTSSVVCPQWLDLYHSVAKK